MTQGGPVETTMRAILLNEREARVLSLVGTPG